MTELFQTGKQMLQWVTGLAFWSGGRRAFQSAMFFYSEAAFGTVGEEIRGLADTTSSGDCDQVELCPSGPIVRWCRLVLSKCESLQIATKTRSDSLHWSSLVQNENPTDPTATEAKVDAEKPDGRVLLADLHTGVLLAPCRSVVPMDKNFGRVRWNDFLFV